MNNDTAWPGLNAVIHHTLRHHTRITVAEAAQRHYSTAELDKRSFPLAQLDFPYPALIGDGRQGTLELTLYVGKDGVVTI